MWNMVSTAFALLLEAEDGDGRSVVGCGESRSIAGGCRTFTCSPPFALRLTPFPLASCSGQPNHVRLAVCIDLLDEQACTS